MNVRIRDAKQSDISQIYIIGTSHKDFAVSKKIRFYEKAEIKEWIRKKSQNIFLVADLNGEVVGFLYCKIMSYDWAMLDNLFVLPEYRRRGIGKGLLQACISNLKMRKLRYLSSLMDAERLKKENYRLMGFKPESRYVWVDRFIN